MTLLQVTEPMQDGLISRLGDQILSIFLLGCFAIYSVREIKQLKEDMRKYRDEDQKEMKEVIAKNTIALDSINLKLGGKIAMLIIGSLLMASCTIFKKHTSLSVKSDSVMQLSEVRTSQIGFIEREIKDTAIVIPTLTVSGEVCAPDLQPIHTISGDTLPRSHTIKGNGITVDLTIRKDGTLHVEGRTDSAKVIVPGVIRETRTQSDSRDSSTTNARTTHEATVDNTVTVKSAFTWFGFVVAAFVILAIIYFIYKKVKAKWTLQRSQE